MNVLVLDPHPRRPRWWVFPSGAGEPSESGRLEGPLGALAGKAPEAIAVRLLHGGEAFRGPVRAAPETVAALEEQVPDAPLHLPAALEVLRSCRGVFPGTPVVLLSETAFFADLPERERACAVEPELAGPLRLRRHGRHGLLHGAACARAARALRRRGRRGTPRILSICLEPKPDLAAVRGSRPVMVTGGVTPLEGLPGETSCGDLDPGLVLSIARDQARGPEEADLLLGRRSGLSALAGRRVTLGEVLLGRGRDLRLPRIVFLHRLLLAAGAGVAALGGIDAVVLSGRYAGAAEALARRIAGKVPVEVFPDPVERVMADLARAAVSAPSSPGREPAVPRGSAGGGL